MTLKRQNREALERELAATRERLEIAEEAMRAIRSGEVDAFVLETAQGQQVFTLEGTEDLSRILLETMGDGAAALNCEGTLLYANRRMADMLGLELDDLIGRRVSNLFGSANRTTLDGLLADPDASASIIYIRPADGNRIHIRLSLGRLIMREITGFSLVAADISALERIAAELRESNEKLTTSNAELEQFAYAASHDLQEPLRMVSSYAQLLARRYQDKLDQDAHDFIAFTVDGTRRMKSLIQDLLKYSRITSRGRHPQPTESCESLADALARLQMAIDETEATITYDPMPVVAADAGQLSQLFQNLLSNAIKFSKPDTPPKIHIEVTDKAEMWRYAVIDNGIGIESQYLDRIFTIFQRLHRAAEYQGNGIGLALCRRIVERHKGTMWVESIPGHGSRFYFTLPKEIGGM